MRICYVAADVSVPHFRGASTHIYEVAKHLEELGHEVHVISRRIDDSQPKYENLQGIHVHRIPRGIIAPLPSSSYQHLGRGEKASTIRDRLYETYLFTLFSLYAGLVSSNIIKKYDIDVVIERESSFGAGAIASMLTQRHMILEVIGPRYSNLSVKKATKILAYTQSMMRNSKSSDKIILVEAAADVHAFQPDLAAGRYVRNKFNLGDSIVIGYVGTFPLWHGVIELVEASTQVLEKVPTAIFLMVGPYFKSTQQHACSLRVSKSFIFTGHIPYVDIPKYINACDILVAPYNPSRSAQRRKYGIGSPLKVFEYMACGKAVIATDLEPIARVIKNMQNGILVPPGDSEALSKEIIHLAMEPGLRNTLGTIARKHVEEQYSWKTFAKKIQQVLKEVSNREQA